MNREPNESPSESIVEPRRLADEGVRPSAQMIRAVRQIEASRAAKQRLLGRVGWLSLVSLFTSYTREAAAAVNAKLITGLVGLGAVVGAGAYALQAPPRSLQAPPPAIAVAPVVATPPPVAASVTLPEPPAPDAAKGLAAGPSTAVAPKAVTPRKVSDPLLSEEIRLFDSARTALQSGQAQQALSRLNQYEERFPSGRFSLEAAALRIEALAASGQPAQARSLARRFIERHPRSLLVERVRRYAAVR